VLVIPLIAMLVFAAQRRMKKASQNARMKLADIMSFLQESILNMKVIQLFTLEKAKAGQFEGHNRESYMAAMREALVRASTTASVMLVGSMAIAIVLLAVVKEAKTSPIFTTGAMTVFMLALVNKTITPLRRVNDVYLNARQAGVAKSRVAQLLAEGTVVADRPGARPVPAALRGNIEFENVYLTYDGETDVLRGLDLSIPAGTTLALVGPSGAGKTTIINLIPRFYDPRDGSITIDGIDIREFTRDSLRRIIGVVPQETILFNATIRENIALGKPEATEQEIIAAARAANAHDFIISFPGGYDTVVGERGSKLSGGQQQRLAIARALLKNPKILIMDEAVSGLDADSEVKIQDAIDHAFRDRTALLIAHRLSTAKRADLIAVIEKGRVAELGTHDELMLHDGLYKKLYDLQFKLKREISVG
ncbi:MAG: ABC transporter ATP-binding protein, partial [bacterium]